MSQLIGVELARPGIWPLASGKTEFTSQMLKDAADFYQASGGQSVPIGLGHNDERFSGEPAFGSVTNVRYVEDDRGPVLLGDLVDMPQWLSAAAPKRWPNRSIEGWQGFEYGGRKYGLVLTGLAFLGMAPPAVRNIKSLQDLQLALAASAAQRIIATAPESDLEDLDDMDDPNEDDEMDEPQLLAAADPKKPYGDVQYADPGYQKDKKKRYPLDSEEHCRAAWSYVNQEDNASKYTPAQLKRIKLRIKAAAKRYGIEISAAAPSQEAPVDAGASSYPSKEGAGMNLAKIREALAGLPDDASDDAVKEVLASAGLAPQTQPPTDPPQPEPAPQPTGPEPKPELVHASGTRVVSESVWTEMQNTIRGLQSFVDKTQREERDQVVAKAVEDGKFTPAQKTHFSKLWDADPKGTRALIDSLTKNTALAVAAMGYSGDGSDDDFDREFGSLFAPKKGGPSRG